MPDDTRPAHTRQVAEPDPSADIPVPAGDGTLIVNTITGRRFIPPIPVPVDPHAIPPGPPGYTLLAEIGRGGMGVVYRAKDTSLDRDVAVKLLRDRFPADGPVASRFLDEARITGQLQHPGIPSVHQVGTLPNGRPFLAMKLIRGQTLDDLLRERTDLVTDRGRFVAVFEQVSQAVGSAHSQGVVHRDLKPANIMVGAFGEVQVMDWGLAKALTGPGRPAGEDSESTLGSEVRSVRDTDSQTQAGSVLGTPAYMPREQAIGAVDQIDARSDVFGLGAILCVILTGQPPFVVSSPVSVSFVSGLTARLRNGINADSGGQYFICPNVFSTSASESRSP